MSWLNTASRTSKTEPARHREVPWLMVAMLLIGGACLLWSRTIGQKPAVDPTATARFPWDRADANGANGKHLVNPSAQRRTGLEDLPRSLIGTEVDGQLEVDAAGHLKLTRGVRNLFDYFLSTVGEESLANVRARIVAYITSHLPLTAAREAEALLDHYLVYEQDRGQAAREAGSNATALSLDAVSQRFDTLQALRAKHFTAPERAAFFADDEALDRFTLARLRVLQDGSLTPADKARRISELTAGLPPAMRADLTVADTVQSLQAITADWKAHGGSPQELRAAREQLVGPDAADRLEALDRQRQQWAGKMQDYKTQQQALAADTSLSDIQRQAALTELQTRLFTPAERLRLGALASASSKSKP